MLLHLVVGGRASAANHDAVTLDIFAIGVVDSGLLLE
jgi:hypothetical protein